MAMGYYIYDVIQATDGQTAFNTSKPYISGTLAVYQNGLLVRAGLDKDYVEEDPTTIRFNYPLTSQDEVIITSLFSSEGLSIDVVSNNSSNPRSLFKKYSSAVKLMNNQKYQVEIAVKGKTVNWSFASKHNPYYSTIDKIRLDTGDLLEGASDEQINHLIYLNSKEAKELVEAAQEGVYTSSTTNTVSSTAKMWVRYKTDMDLVYSMYLSLSGVSGSIVKKIGEINIEKTVKLPFLSDMLSRFQNLFKPYDELMRTTGTTAVQAFVKAGTSNSYSARGSF